MTRRPSTHAVAHPDDNVCHGHDADRRRRRRRAPPQAAPATMPTTDAGVGRRDDDDALGWRAGRLPDAVGGFIRDVRASDCGVAR